MLHTQITQMHRCQNTHSKRPEEKTVIDESVTVSKCQETIPLKLIWSKKSKGKGVLLHLFVSTEAVDQ